MWEVSLAGLLILIWREGSFGLELTLGLGRLKIEGVLLKFIIDELFVVFVLFEG
jgi:hypothetical protein